MKINILMIAILRYISVFVLYLMNCKQHPDIFKFQKSSRHSHCFLMITDRMKQTITLLVSLGSQYLFIFFLYLISPSYLLGLSNKQSRVVLLSSRLNFRYLWSPSPLKISLGKYLQITS